jgi:hypothetical protein
VEVELAHRVLAAARAAGSFVGELGGTRGGNYKGTVRTK